MKVIISYFIFNTFILFAISFPYGPQNLEEGVHGKTLVSQEQVQRGKRQFGLGYPSPYGSLSNYEPSQQFIFQRAPITFTQRDHSQQPWQEFQRSSSYSNTERTIPQPEISILKRFYPNDNRQYFQLQGNGRSFDSNEHIPEWQFQNQVDQLTDPIQRRQWFPATNSKLIANNVRWNEPSSFNSYQRSDPYGRQFSGYRQINFNEHLQPIKFTNKNSSPNYQSNTYEADFPTLTQTPNHGTLFFPSSSGRTLKQDSPVKAAPIYYDTQNNPLGNTNIRQIIPTPQEVFNSALSIGSNIFEKVPGYKLTTNTIGFFNNITRAGAQYLANNGLPILSPHRPNFLFPFQNRPLNLPPPYDLPNPIPTPVSTSTPHVESTTNSILEGDAPSTDNFNKPIIAADDPGSNENNDQPDSNADNYNNGSNESSNDSHQDGSNDNQQYSQESSGSSNRNSHEDRIETEGHSVTAEGSASEEANSEPSDNNSQAVASDILPDEDYGITDDDDKIDTKAIKSVLG